MTDDLLDRAREYAEYTKHVPVSGMVLALVERVQQAEAERDRLKRGGATLGKALDDALWDIAKATRSTGLLDETRDGDWGLIFDRLATLGDRAETAEAERDAARGQLDKVRDWASRAAYPVQETDIDTGHTAGLNDAKSQVLAILDGKTGG